MKTIKLQNGEIRKGYEFADLSEDAQNKVLAEQVDFEIEIMGSIGKDSPYYKLAEKMDRMQTPWFLASEIYHNHKPDLIESIDINGYLFDENGDMLPINYHTKGNEIVRITYGKKQYAAEFI